MKGRIVLTAWLAFFGPLLVPGPGVAGQDTTEVKKAEDAGPGALARASELLKAGKPAAAVLVLDGLLAEDPDNREALLALGQAHLAQKKFQHALNAFSAIILKDPNVPAAVSGRALALAGLGDVPKAVTWAKKATEMAPDDLQAWEVLGRIYLTETYLDAPRAEATFRQLLVLAPGNRPARMHLARALSYQKKVDEAIGLLEKLVEEGPDDLPVQVKLAESYYAVRQLTKAERVIQQILVAQPDHAEAARLLAEVRGRKSYNFWVPVVAILAIPLLYLGFRRMRKGREIKT